MTLPSRPGRGQALAGLAAVLLSLPACKPPQPPPPAAASPAPLPAASDPGHQRMLRELAAIRDRTPDENRYLGDKLVRDLQARLDGLAPGSPLPQRWEILRLLGVAELRLGRESEGIAHLEEARSLLPQVQQTIGGKRVQDTLFQLSVGYMRFGETQNCCALNSPDSCIVPIRGGGLHTRREGSEKAIQTLLELLQLPAADNEQRFAALWLLNLAAMTLGDYPQSVPEEVRIPEKVFRSEIEFPRFVNIAGALGLDSFNCSGGVAIDDFDNDGALDVFTTTWDTSGDPHLFLNQGDGSFQDTAAAAGLTGISGGLNVVQADYNNDGWMDVFVLRGAWLADKGRYPNSLLRNNGREPGASTVTFTDVTFDAGLGEVHYPTQTGAWADYDLDGDVDLFIGNETTKALQAPCQLFRNNGDGSFTDVAAAAGVENLAFCKGAAWGDFDADRDPDLYLSNYQGPNRLYRNNGDGAFSDVAAALGVDLPRNSFPVWFWDFDNDGHLDIFASSYTGRSAYHAAFHMGFPVNIEFAGLYRNDGQGGFENVAKSHGLHLPMLPMGANWGDLDNDGFPDFYLGTGDTRYESLLPNQMFLNQGGRKFVDVTMAGGFGHLQKGHAVAFADLDGDGDQDVFEQVGGAYLGDKFRDALFENPGFGNRWIAVQLEGVRSNRAGIGAHLRADIEEAGGARRSVHREVSSGGSFGANPLRQTLGLGRAERLLTLEIFWPASDTRQRVENVPLDRVITVREGQPGFRELDVPAARFKGSAPGR